jgi:hypothetical protein
VSGEYSNLVYSNAGAHNSIFRGKSLGTIITSEQYAAIQAGTFDDMFVGDYWTITINNTATICRIAGFDLYLHTGAVGGEVTKHHVVLIPDTALANRRMNSSDTTTGGYKGSEWFTGSSSTTGTRNWCKAKLDTAFGNKLLRIKDIITNAINASAQTPGGYIPNHTGCASGWEWVDSYCDLLTEIEVFGSRIWSSGWDIGVCNRQFPLFALAPEFIMPGTGSSRNYWWLRGIGSSTRFTMVDASGPSNTDISTPSSAFGIRPKWCIG